MNERFSLQKVAWSFLNFKMDTVYPYLTDSFGVTQERCR
jgi:hypothetical protein